MTTTATASAVEAPPRFSWNLVPAALVALSAFLMFGVKLESAAYPVLAIGIASGFLLDRDLGPFGGGEPLIPPDGPEQAHRPSQRIVVDLAAPLIGQERVEAAVLENPPDRLRPAGHRMRDGVVLGTSGLSPTFDHSP